MGRDQIKVLQVVPSLSKAGGVERFVYNMAMHHDEQRVHYDFLHHSTIDGRLMQAQTYDNELIHQGSKVYTVNYAGHNIIRFVKEVNAFFKKHGKEYDIVHCHMPNTAFCILRDAKKVGIKHRVLHSHLNNSSDIFLHQVRNLPLNIIGKRYATDRIACSIEAGRFLFGHKSFSVIHNGISIDDFEYRAVLNKKNRSDLGIMPESPVVGCVGRMVKQKNYTFAVKVFSKFLKRHPNAKLVFIGDGVERETLEQEIQDESVSESVLMLGVRDDVNRLYSMLDVFLMPSLYEGLPVSCVEAQAAGLTCVYSNDVPKESDITGTGLFISRSADIQCWVDALEMAIDRGRLYHNPSILAEKGYSASENAELLMDYYERIVSTL